MISLVLQTIKLITALIALLTLSPFFGAIGSLTALGFMIALLVGLLVLISDITHRQNPP